MCELTYMLIFCAKKVAGIGVRLLTSCSWARKGIGSSLSRLVRTTAISPLRLTCEPSSPMTAFSRILFLVELAIAEMACVSRNIRRTFHVPSGVPVQRSISERDCSHPGVVEFVFAEIASTSQTIRTSFLTMFTLVWSSGRFLTAKTHILVFI